MAMVREANQPTLVYPVRRGEPELVGPAAPTPRETKLLSDLDDPHSSRMHARGAFFYRGRDDGVDPAGIIRRALGEALVHYYPMAGRLRETEDERLVVECTGEGVLFVQAHADVRLVDLEEAGAGLRPPFPCWDQLLFEEEGSSGMLNTPLLLIQVTRLSCGGFVLAVRYNHTICDGQGIVQFLSAVSQFARGLPCMTVTPVWSRELIRARCPPRPSLILRQFMELTPAPAGDMVMRSFTFGASDVAAIKQSLPPLLRDTATSFDALAAFLWRARTTALQQPPGEEAPLVLPSSCRTKMRLPEGYYGNAVVLSIVLADGTALLGGSLGDAVALVRRQKAALTNEHVLALIDEMVLVGRRWILPPNMFMLSDTTRLGLGRLDMGWGDPVYSGPPQASHGVSFLVAVKDRHGDDAVSVPVVLPPLAMLRFAAEVERLLASCLKTPPRLGSRL